VSGGLRTSFSVSPHRPTPCCALSTSPHSGCQVRASLVCGTVLAWSGGRGRSCPLTHFVRASDVSQNERALTQFLSLEHSQLSLVCLL
jgi:hypothetical protein